MKSLIALPVVMVAAVAPAMAQEAAPKVVFYGWGSPDDPSIIRQVRPIDIDSWVSAADYPAAALAAGRSGDVRVIVNVGADGTVATCEARPIGAVDVAFGAKACEIIRKRGRFLYAIDTVGKARPGIVELSLRFALPRSGGMNAWGPAPPTPASLNTSPRLLDSSVMVLPFKSKLFINRSPSVVLDIDTTGRVTQCRINTSSGTDAGDAKLCKVMRAARFEPARTRDGVAVERTYFGVTFQVES